MTYVNIDLLEKTKDKFKLTRHNNNEMFEEDKHEEKKHQKVDEVFKSEDGVVFAKDITIGPVKPKDVKVYKLYSIDETENLRMVVKRFFEDYPATKKYYTESQLINEIVRDNNLREMPLNRNLSGVYSLTIPAYLSVEKSDLERLNELPAYQEHFVTLDERTFYKIVINEGYTKNAKEIEELVYIMQEINGVQKPELFATITIPNVERYKLERLLQKEEEIKQKINL